MKILFISSGNNKFGISPIVFNQGESLKQNEIEIEYLTIKGKGLFGYLKNIPQIRSKLNNTNYDLIHGHYSLSALAATLSFPKIPLVVSLMGTDSKMNLLWRSLIKLNYILFWQKVIVKSKEMRDNLKLKKAVVIPNGVNLEKYNVFKKEEAIRKMGLSLNKTYILFLSNPSRYEKNYKLAETAVNLIDYNSVELLPVFNKEHLQVIKYLYAADLLLMTSLWEGSPNAVKEAMSCNIPVVSTDVGDVKWLFGNEPGHYLTSFKPEDVAEKIREALEFSEKEGRTNGRNRIIQLGLDSENATNKIINVYKEVLKRK